MLNRAIASRSPPTATRPSSELRGYNGFAGATWVYVRIRVRHGPSRRNSSATEGSADRRAGLQRRAVGRRQHRADRRPRRGRAPKQSSRAPRGCSPARARTWSEQQKLIGSRRQAPVPNRGTAWRSLQNGNTALVGGQDNEEGGSGRRVGVHARSGANWTQQGEKLVGKHGAEIGLSRAGAWRSRVTATPR